MADLKGKWLEDGSIAESKLKDDAVSKRTINADVAGQGLKQAADGSLEVNVDNVSLEIVSDKVQIKAGSITGESLNSSIAGDALELVAGVLNVRTDGVTLDVNASNNLFVKDDSITSAKIASSPNLRGTPTAPTPALASDSTQIATTAYVKAKSAADVAVEAQARVDGDTLLSGRIDTAETDIDTLQTQVSNLGSRTTAAESAIVTLQAHDTNHESRISANETAIAGHAGRLNTIETTLPNKLDANKLGAPGGAASLDLSGKLLTSQLPALSISSVYVVSSEAEQLALDAQEGDFAKRVDLTPLKVYIHNGGTAGTMADWTDVTTQGEVISVNGQTGVVSLDTASVLESPTGGKYFTDARAKAATVLDAAIAAGVTDKAPSVNSVYQALQAKQDLFYSRYQNFTMDAAALVRGYIDLGWTARENSIFLHPRGGNERDINEDFSVNYTGGTSGVTRITLLPAFLDKLEQGDDVIVYFESH
jgi:hypothetical protein